MAEASAPPAGPAPPSALSAVTEAAESDSVSADTLSDSASMGGSSEVGSSIGSAVSSLAGEADGDDVIAFAKYLGMDPAADRDLLWIAHQALNATLPSEWTEHEECALPPAPSARALAAPAPARLTLAARRARSSDGNQYFFNATTKQSSWEHPLDDYFRRLYAQHKKQRAAAAADGADRFPAADSADGADRFPAFVTFPVADDDDELAALQDPVGPRERVKQWVGAQKPTERVGNQNRKLRQYTSTGTDSALKPSADPNGVAPEEGGTRRGKRGSWQAGESGEAAAAQALAWQLEAMELSSTGDAKQPEMPMAAAVAAAAGGQGAVAAARDEAADAAASSGASPKGEGSQAQEKPPALTLSEVFSFPGAAVMTTSSGGRSAAAGSGSFSRSKSAQSVPPSKAITKRERPREPAQAAAESARRARERELA